MTYIRTNIASFKMIKFLTTVSTAILLAACQTTGTSEYESTHATIEENANANTLTAKKTAVSYAKDSAGTVTVKRDGETYTFTNDDLVDGYEDHYLKTIDGKDVRLKNYSTVFKDHDNHETQDVSLWYIGINGNDGTYSTGYVDFGNKTETMPTNLSATYAGRVQGYSINKNTANYGWVNGAANFEANFAPDQQTITGGFSDLEIIGGNYSGTDSVPDITLTNGTITNGTFSGDLSVANTTVVSSSIEGSFYGESAAEIGGIGQLETDNTHTTFGFTGAKN